MKKRRKVRRALQLNSGVMQADELKALFWSEQYFPDMKTTDRIMPMLFRHINEATKSSVLLSYPLCITFSHRVREVPEFGTHLRLMSLVVVSVRLNIESHSHCP